MVRKLHILHIDDDPDDLFFVRRAIERASSHFQVHGVKNGDEAIDYLSRMGQFADLESSPAPDLLLLDLKLPDVDGFDLLAWARAHPQFRHVPVVVLSGAQHDADERCARALGAVCYLVKTSRYENLAAVVCRLLASKLPLPIAALLPESAASLAAASRH